MQVIKFASATGFRACPSVFAWHSLIDSAKKKIRAYRQSFSAWRWAAEVIRPLHWDMKFDFECPRAVRCTWIKCHWKLVHSPYQHPSASGLWKMLSNGSPRSCRELSTIVRWLSYVDIAWLVGLRDGSPRAVLSLYFLAVMMLEVMYQTSLTSKRSPINPGTTIANGFNSNRRRKSACWTNSWQVFPNIFRSKFGEDIADLCIDCVDVQWLLALVGGGNPSGSPRRSSWTTPRTWMVPCQGWSSQNLCYHKSSFPNFSHRVPHVFEEWFG